MTGYWFPTAFSCWGDEEKAAIERVVSSGQFTMGREVACFEREFAEYHGMKHGVMVNSGSSANLIAVAALFHKRDNPLKRGDKVIVPAIAWSTTYAPLVQHGLGLCLSDVDDTWNAAETPRAVQPDDVGLVVGCSILGNPAHLSRLKAYARAMGAYFIEDNCESLGARGDDGKLCGTFGLMNTFSFFYSHQISAIEGGMILTDDDECAELCRMLRAHGWTRDIRKPETFADEYDFRLFGYNVRPLEMHAAIAREQLKKLPLFVQERRCNWAYFRKISDDLPITHPVINGDMSPFGLQFTVEDTETRAFLAASLREAGIDCRLPTGGSFRLHEYGKPWHNQHTPNADRIHQTGLFLGNAPYDISDKIERAVKVIKETLT